MSYLPPEIAHIFTVLKVALGSFVPNADFVFAFVGGWSTTLVPDYWQQSRRSSKVNCLPSRTRQA
jgi:hypothetical protein